MKDDTNEILSAMLVDWHRWACGYKHVGGINTSPMFREVKTGRQWDSVDEIIDSDIEHSRMDALDHIIMALPEQQRTALQIQARNLHTGKAVWNSARLPANEGERVLLLIGARSALVLKLQEAGVM